MSTNRPRVTLVTSNGWGLGHLSRAIAIALAIGETADVTMFSFSRGLSLALQFGINGEFCPGPATTWIPEERWNAYVERRFGLFVSEVDPDVVLFDGVAPYWGVIRALDDRPGISSGWLRRGMWLPDRTTAQLEKTSRFDFVVEPGDLAAEADRGPTSDLESIEVPPVTLFDVVPALDRNTAAAELGLDPARPTLLFAIGSGQPGEMDVVRGLALERAYAHDEWQVGLVNSPLSSRKPAETPGVVQLRGVYPLVRYLAAFDAAISAAGYNSIHELIPAGVPTLLVPKSASNTDDQITRASFLAEKGMALNARDDDPDAVGRELNRLLGEEGLRSSLRAEARAANTGGADEVARVLTGSPPTGVREPGQADDEPPPSLKRFVKDMIGPKGVKWVQRSLGREQERPRRTTVSTKGNDPDAPHLVVTSDTTAVAGSADHPVEHVLAEASSDYVGLRRDLLEDFYEIVP